jgi:hypothetical protein
MLGLRTICCQTAAGIAAPDRLVPGWWQTGSCDSSGANFRLAVTWDQSEVGSYATDLYNTLLYPGLSPRLNFAGFEQF